MGGATLLKLALWAASCALRRQSGAALALAEDHMNDVVSSAGAMATAGAAARWRAALWWVDPAGGIAIALFIALRWTLISRRQASRRRDSRRVGSRRGAALCCVGPPAARQLCQPCESALLTARCRPPCTASALAPALPPALHLRRGLARHCPCMASLSQLTHPPATNAGGHALLGRRLMARPCIHLKPESLHTHKQLP